MLRIGRVSVAIRRFVRSYTRIPQLDRNQLERYSWTGTNYIARDRLLTDRVSYVYKYLLVPQVE
jgi:hypothetical protein